MEAEALSKPSKVPISPAGSAEVVDGFEVPTEQIQSCPGCEVSGADPTCTVRPCSIEKNMENCAHCEQFACDKLEPKMNFVEENVKVDLSEIPEEDFNLFIKPFMSKEYLIKIRESLET